MFWVPFPAFTFFAFLSPPLFIFKFHLMWETREIREEKPTLQFFSA